MNGSGSGRTAKQTPSGLQITVIKLDDYDVRSMTSSILVRLAI